VIFFWLTVKIKKSFKKINLLVSTLEALTTLWQCCIKALTLLTLTMMREPYCCFITLRSPQCLTITIPTNSTTYYFISFKIYKVKVHILQTNSMVHLQDMAMGEGNIANEAHDVFMTTIIWIVCLFTLLLIFNI